METQPLRHLKRASIWAATAAMIAETGVKNMMMTTLFTLGTPATATGFVYEIVQMRHARLEREATDRVKFAARTETPAETIVAEPEPNPAQQAALGEPIAVTDLPRKLAAMRIAREHFVDIYGGSPEAVAPAYQKIARQMLDEDDRIFEKLAAQKKADPTEYAGRYKAEEAVLRTLHAAIDTLSPSKVATSDGTR